MPSPDGPGYLTIRQVARRLQVDPKTVRRMTAREHDRLPAIRVGGTKRGPIRIREDHLQEWLDKHRFASADDDDLNDD